MNRKPRIKTVRFLHSPKMPDEPQNDGHSRFMTETASVHVRILKATTFNENHIGYESTCPLNVLAN